jgi:hypothetical protein
MGLLITCPLGAFDGHTLLSPTVKRTSQVHEHFRLGQRQPPQIATPAGYLCTPAFEPSRALQTEPSVLLAHRWASCSSSHVAALASLAQEHHTKKRGECDR